MTNIEWSFERYYTPEAKEKAQKCLECTREKCEGYCEAFVGPHGEGKKIRRNSPYNKLFRFIGITQPEVAAEMGMEYRAFIRLVLSNLTDEQKNMIRDAAFKAARRKHGEL